MPWESWNSALSYSIKTMGQGKVLNGKWVAQTRLHHLSFYILL